MRYRLKYVSDNPVSPVPMRELLSDRPKQFEAALDRKLRRLTNEQAEELHSVLRQHGTDAVTDGDTAFTLHAGWVWSMNLAAEADDGPATCRRTETGAD